ncbi:MAG TPA: methyltransferase [Pyrinomonadaceae bacterium]|nr:methyltransferase [Pyrinomonadaceae bacterium]
MTRSLKHPDGEVSISDVGNGRVKIEVHPNSETMFVPIRSCETSYPIDLIEKILQVKGVAWLCDEIDRDEDPNYVERLLLNDINAYFSTNYFAGKRILDFGCGSGASTAILARTFPESEIVGIELLDDLLEIARARQKHYGFENVTFLRSPEGSKLPDDIGDFDIAIMSAVYEHLLPAERKTILPSLWDLILPNGILFLNQTPNRLFPFELHTTMLPLINYLPDGLTHAVTRKFSKRIDPEDSWESLLRQGIRGATVREIISNLPNNAKLLEPSQKGLSDRIDLWFLNTNPNQKRTLKLVARSVMKGLKAVTGISVVSDLSLAIRKISA